MRLSNSHRTGDKSTIFSAIMKGCKTIFWGNSKILILYTCEMWFKIKISCLKPTFNCFWWQNDHTRGYPVFKPQRRPNRQNRYRAIFQGQYSVIPLRLVLGNKTIKSKQAIAFPFLCKFRIVHFFPKVCVLSDWNGNNSTRSLTFCLKTIYIFGGFWFGKCSVIVSLH